MRHLPLVLVGFLALNLCSPWLKARAASPEDPAAEEDEAKPAKKKYVPVYPKDLKVDIDVPFLPAGRKEKLDIYYPPDAKPGELRPAVVYFHGGGFNDGDKARGREVSICSDLAKAGFVAISVNYKLRKMQGQVTWPQNIHDAKSAVRWVRANAARLGIDPDRIGSLGTSAGGNIAVMMAVTQPKDGLEPPEGDANVSTAVACAVDLYGAVDLMNYHDMKMFAKTRAEAPELYVKASPTTYVDKADPPVLLVHGTADKVVDVSQSKTLAAILEKAGVPHQLILIPEAPHTFDLRPLEQDIREDVFKFLRQHLGGTKASGS